MTTNNPQQAFYSLLIKCLDNNNEERKKAEMQITKISETNYEDVLLNCSFFLMNDSLPKNRVWKRNTNFTGEKPCRQHLINITGAKSW